MKVKLVLFLSIFLISLNSYSSSKKNILFKSPFQLTNVKFIDSNGKELIASTSTSKIVRDVNKTKWFSAHEDTYQDYYYITFITSKKAKWVKIIHKDFYIELLDLDNKNKYKPKSEIGQLALRRWISVYYKKEYAKSNNVARYDFYTGKEINQSLEQQGKNLKRALQNYVDTDRNSKNNYNSYIIITNKGVKHTLVDVKIVHDDKGIIKAHYYENNIPILIDKEVTNTYSINQIDKIIISNYKSESMYGKATSRFILKSGESVDGILSILYVDGHDASSGTKKRISAFHINSIIFPK